jgi:hypothetical protein
VKLQLRSRRMFLQGTGGVLLAIPTLPSLLWKAARVEAQDTITPVRYVQWITNHGVFEPHFWPASTYTPGEPDADGVRVRALTDIPERLSPILSEGFDPVRGKMNLLRGLDLMVGPGFHNAGVPTCASWPRQDNLVPAFAYSVDSILETSTKIYPTPVRTPALRMTPGVNPASVWGSFCWTTKAGKPTKLTAYHSPKTALDEVFAGAQQDPKLAAQDATLRLVDQVKDDYRHVAKLNALAAADKELLSNYIDLLADVQRRTTSNVSACRTPQLANQTNFDVLHKNATDIAIAALLCGATRVVCYHCYHGSASQYDESSFHSWCHNDKDRHRELMTYRYGQLARLLCAMDQVKEANGKTLLDNSLVYAGNELSDPGHGAKHLQSLPVILAGSAGGKLTTDRYIDYSGRLFNNLLISIFHVLGLGPSDYERDNVVGFGDYQGRNQQSYTRFLTNEERRKPLPRLF